MTIDDVGQKTLEEIAHDIGIDLPRWSNECALVTRRIARSYALEDVQLLQLVNDGTGNQQFHEMLIASDGRVLDALECQARQNQLPENCSSWHPFVGTRVGWGQARGFDALRGTVVAVPPRLRWAI